VCEETRQHGSGGGRRKRTRTTGTSPAAYLTITTHKSALMRRLIAAREWLTVFYLPTTAPELNPVEGVWAVMKSGLVNLVKREIDQLRDIVKHRLRCMQYRPELLAGLLAKTGLDPRPP
jgi:transposase